MIRAARTWLGTRWVHQGRNHHGVDCAGLVIKVHHQLGLPCEDRQGYRRAPNAREFLEHIRGQSLPAPAPEPGAIGIFKQDRFACHIGFFGWHPAYDCLSIIHAHAAYQSVVEEPFTKEWAFHLVECRYVKGLKD